MFLARMTGLIALSVAATTLQANARPVPKPPVPAKPEQPKPANPQIPEVDRTNNKQELILVLAPTTSAWSESGNDHHLDGSGSPPAPNKATVGAGQSTFDPAEIRQARDLRLVQPPIQIARAWLAARYPHAPPQEG